MNSDDACIKYFIYKNMGENQAQKYGYYKRIIGYILDNIDLGFIRKTFLSLVKKGYLVKIQNGNKKSYGYRFVDLDNMNDKVEVVEEIKPYLITWD